MKSIKPGRGPSAMGAMSAVFAAVFGVFWTIMAVQMGAPWFFVLFGVFFIVQAIVQVFYNYKNATSKNRFSSFDITDSSEEDDMYNEIFNSQQENGYNPSLDAKFCPYCGKAIDCDFEFCMSCGKKIPN